MGNDIFTKVWSSNFEIFENINKFYSHSFILFTVNTSIRIMQIYVNVIKDMYEGANTEVRSLCGKIKNIEISV